MLPKVSYIITYCHTGEWFYIMKIGLLYQKLKTNIVK